MAVVLAVSLSVQQSHAGIATLVVGTSAIQEYQLGRTATTTIYILGGSMIIGGIFLASAAGNNTGIMSSLYGSQITHPSVHTGYGLILLDQTPAEQTQALATELKAAFPKLSLNQGATCLAEKLEQAIAQSQTQSTEGESTLLNPAGKPVAKIARGSSIRTAGLQAIEISDCVDQEDLSSNAKDELTIQLFDVLK